MNELIHRIKVTIFMEVVIVVITLMQIERRLRGNRRR
jgi:hypothetical protein